ncbi:sensor histidine kinase [Halovenus salina]|uniref:sensor histidine kinase n=1 Tax=Halovenus salina TaxID=1510225 RepID=UPI002260DBDA|nr:sensor histidine kinase [Halovenus salina]
MATHVSLILFLAVVAGFVLAGIGVDGYRRWEHPGSGLVAGYLALCGLIPIASLSFAVVNSETLPTLVFLGLWCLSTVVWFLFALQYTGSYTRQRPLLAVVLLVPSLVLVPWLVEPVGSAGATASALSAVALSTYSAFALIGSLLVFRSTVLDEYISLSSGSVLVVLGIAPSLTVTLFGQLTDQDVTLLSASIFAAGFGISAVAAVLAVFRYGIFDPVPTAGLVGERAMLRETDDLVAIVDTDDRVLSLNERVRATVVEESTPLGTDIERVLGHTSQRFAERDTIDLDTARGVRQFDSQVSQLTDGHGRELGAIVSLRDVTDRELRKQRLEVFNRILGHNIRNEVSVITANAEVVADQTEDDLATRLDTAIDAADSLDSQGTKARRIEEILAADEQRRFELGAFLNALTDEHERRWPGASVTIEAQPDREIHCDRAALRFVLDNLVENAVEHAETDTPRVVLAAAVEPGERYPVVIEVRDNGPGIPDRERSVVEGGEETPLEHGSGVGLWVTNWATTDLGGDLSFTQRDAGGTVARVGLPSSVLVDGSTD